MKTIIDEARSTERASDRKRLLTRGVVAIAVAGLLVGGGAGVANAAAPKVPSVSGNPAIGVQGYTPSVSGGVTTYTVPVGASGAVSITAQGTGFAPANPSPTTFGPDFRFPTFAGFYVSVGNVTLNGSGQWRPTVTGTAGQIQAGKTWWVNNANPTPGQQRVGGVWQTIADQRLLSSGGGWTAPFEFTVTKVSNSEYRLSGTRTGQSGNPETYTLTSTQPIFQVVTRAALGAYTSSGSIEQVVNLQFTGL